MNSRQIRRTNLLRLITEHESIEALAATATVSASYLSQIKNDTRGMGAKFARKLEMSLGLPENWMDQLHDNHSAVAHRFPEEITYFRRLSREQRDAIRTILKAMVGGKPPPK